MHQQVEPQMMGPSGPYHHPMPPMPQHMPYHDQQIPTTSHPSWHQGYPESPYQMHPGGPQTVNYPMPPQPQQAQMQQAQMMQQQMQQQQQQQAPPQIPPQQLPPQPQQQQQPQQPQQGPPSYSSPSPSRGPPAPPQNQKFRTEQWINNAQWPYTQSPAPPVCPSVMSYHQGQNDDRMSMLSVNTQMTAQYPDVASQRCYSSNGSTCENVNPEMMQVTVTQAAESALRAWFPNQDPIQRIAMAKAIRAWVKQEKFGNIDPGLLPKYIKQILDIVYDGIRPPAVQVQLPQTYFAQLYYYLLDILRRVAFFALNTQHVQMVIELFQPKNPPENCHLDFRELFCQFLNWRGNAEPHMKHCTNIAFQLLQTLIMNTKQDKIRSEFGQCLKFSRLVYTLLEYLEPGVPIQFMNISVFLILRFIISKDNVIKDSFIWQKETKGKVPPQDSVVYKLTMYMSRIQVALQTPECQEIAPLLIQSIVRTFDLLGLLLHDSEAIDGFVKLDGVGSICNVLRCPHPDVARAGFKLLLQVSDARALATIPLNAILPFLMSLIHGSQDDDVIYSGTGFLSNVVAHKQHVKELAIHHNAIVLLYMLINRFPKLTELPDFQKRNRVGEIYCNILRTLNNFLMMWIPTQNGENRVASANEKPQVLKFIEVDILKKLMNCLSADGIDTPCLLELRSTILRSIILLIRTPFIPKEGLLAVMDDIRRENLIAHVCASYAWACQQVVNHRNAPTKQQLIERAINVLLMFMENCGAEEQVAQYSYAIECPLQLLETEQGVQLKPTFVHNVLMVCDKILEHCPSRADIWTVDRAMLETLTNHRSAEIAKTANSVLSKLPENDPLAGILSSRFYC